MRILKEIPYRTLSSVAWVNKYWVLTVLAVVFVINVLSFQLNLDGFWAILVLMFVLVGLLSYPYYHYRRSGGFVKRIPPRFVTEKPVFVQKYE